MSSEKRFPIEIIVFLFSVFSFLTCQVHLPPFCIGFYGIFDIGSLILALFFCIKKIIKHDRTRMIMVLFAFLISFAALMSTIDTYIRYGEILSLAH